MAPPPPRTDPPVSLRGGKFYPSQRYKPEQGYKANLTNWRFGPPEKTSYVSTMRDAQRESASVPPHELALRQPRIDKNASDKVSDSDDDDNTDANKLAFAFT